MKSNTDISEREVMEEAKTSLAGLKNEVSENRTDELIKQKLADFGKFVEKQDLKKIDRSTTLGRFVRIARYGDHIREASKTHNIPFDYLFALTMVESQGNTASINETDGGAGFIHFQPDVAREYGMKVFTDNPKYKKYDFAIMKKQGKSKRDIYKKHGEVLRGLMGKSMSVLENLDDRFHTAKCINATATYLQKIRTQYVDKYSEKRCNDASWDVYKNDVNYDFKWMLTLNAFNKGPNNFATHFDDGGHVERVKTNLRAMRKYKEYVANNLFSGKSYQQVFEGLQKTKFDLKKD